MTQKERLTAIEAKVTEMQRTWDETIRSMAPRGCSYDDTLAPQDHRIRESPESADGPTQYCTMRQMPEMQLNSGISDHRRRAIIDSSMKWSNGHTLRYYLFSNGSFGGSRSQQDVVRRAYSTWKQLGIGLNFEEVQTPNEAHFRIGFQRGDGSWSYVGQEALQLGANERTMNFGWDITVSGPNGLDTALHEVGHALGFHHAHQNPFAGIQWNEQAVYDHFARTQNPPWSRQTTDANIINKLNPSQVQGV